MLLCINGMYTDGVEPNHDAGLLCCCKALFDHYKTHQNYEKKTELHKTTRAHTCMVHCSSMVHNYVHADADAAVMNYAYGLVVLDSGYDQVHQ